MSGKNDFDFLIGNWKVHNCKLKERLKNSDEWEEFEATLEVKSILEGQGNIDMYKSELRGKYLEGITMRLFNPRTKLWSLYWVDNWCVKLQPPLVGKFKNGVGEFFCEDVFESKLIRIRFIWKKTSLNSAFWEQAFSSDDGKSWEINWTMDFRRVS